MRSVVLHGFDAKGHNYQFNTTPIGDKTAVIFVADDLRKTSITNVIEHLTSKVHAKYLSDTPPESLRVFEYYPRTLDPLVVWQEVTFEVGPIHAHQSLLQRLLRMKPKRIGWAFGNPRWKPVPSSLQSLLQSTLVA